MALRPIGSCVDLLGLAFCCYAVQELRRPNVVIVEKEGGSKASGTVGAVGVLGGVQSQAMQREQVEIMASNGAVLPLLAIHESE